MLDPWVFFGFFAQFVFFCRVIVQWVATERAKKVVVPELFWYLSIAGCIMIFVYAVHRIDIVFMVSAFLNLLFSARSLILHRGYKANEAP